jgi:hypothetical protein
MAYENLILQSGRISQVSDREGELHMICVFD